MTSILLIDNYDSFTYNLVHYLRLAGAEVTVVRNSNIPTISFADHDGIVISPGPGRPENAGQLMNFINAIPLHMPVLGICLGMQAIGLSLSIPLVHAPLPMHGKTSLINHNQKGIFTDIKSPTQVMRYHSLILENKLRDDMEAIAYSDDGILMAIKHKDRPWVGVQFHPESIGTDYGQQMISNWVRQL